MKTIKIDGNVWTPRKSTIEKILVDLPSRDGDFDHDENVKNALLNAACEKFYGKNCFWWANNGTRGFGQVCRPMETGGNNCLTSIVRGEVI